MNHKRKMWIWSDLIRGTISIWVMRNDHVRRMCMKIRNQDDHDHGDNGGHDNNDYHDDHVVHLPHGDWLLWFSRLAHLPRPKAATDLILIFLTLLFFNPCYFSILVIFHWFFGWFVNFDDVQGAVLRNPCMSIWAVMALVNDSAVQFSPKTIDETSLMRFI